MLGRSRAGAARPVRVVLAPAECVVRHRNDVHTLESKGRRMRRYDAPMRTGKGTKRWLRITANARICAAQLGPASTQAEPSSLAPFCRERAFGPGLGGWAQPTSVTARGDASSRGYTALVAVASAVPPSVRALGRKNRHDPVLRPAATGSTLGGLPARPEFSGALPATSPSPGRRQARARASIHARSPAGSSSASSAALSRDRSRWIARATSALVTPWRGRPTSSTASPRPIDPSLTIRR